MFIFGKWLQILPDCTISSLFLKKCQRRACPGPPSASRFWGMGLWRFGHQWFSALTALFKKSPSPLYFSFFGGSPESPVSSSLYFHDFAWALTQLPVPRGLVFWRSDSLSKKLAISNNDWRRLGDSSGRRSTLLLLFLADESTDCYDVRLVPGVWIHNQCTILDQIFSVAEGLSLR